MRRPASLLLAMAAFATWTLVTSSVVGAAPRQLTANDLREQFSSCGFDVPNTRAGAVSPYVVIRDIGITNTSGVDARVLMAIVYRDASTASAAHRLAHRRA